MLHAVNPVIVNARIEEDIWNLPEVPIGMEEWNWFKFQCHVIDHDEEWKWVKEIWQRTKCTVQMMEKHFMAQIKHWHWKILQLCDDVLSDVDGENHKIRFVFTSRVILLNCKHILYLYSTVLNNVGWSNTNHGMRNAVEFQSPCMGKELVSQ